MTSLQGWTVRGWTVRGWTGRGWTGRGRSSPIAVVLIVAAVLTVVAVSCTDQGADQQGEVTPSTRPLPVGEADLAPAVPVDDSTFCLTLLALDDDDDPPTLDDLTASYVDLLDEVPAEIRPEFEIVLAGLVTAGDGRPADPAVEAAAEALAEFVAVRCRGTGVNPLPPPTVPD